ncbi:Dps family protein [Priestia sp. YIM B13448]|uniref:Dps family protein n=1 Tax=Priestia sp. YIM B13448 TaxID=3366308 RepID=UPI003671AAF0
MAVNVNEIVNKQVANFSVMYIKLHNFHWYVKGEQFFTLHEKFEELYTETATIIDDLAERLLALEGKPVATMKESLELSSIKEAGDETTGDMLLAIHQSLEKHTWMLKSFLGK